MDGKALLYEMLKIPCEAFGFELIADRHLRRARLVSRPAKSLNGVGVCYLSGKTDTK